MLILLFFIAYQIEPREIRIRRPQAGDCRLPEEVQRASQTKRSHFDYNACNKE